MLIYDELKQDHQKVKSLLDQLAHTENADNRRELIAEIRDHLVPHARAEEAALYNVLRDLDASKDLVAHCYQEHVMAETLLRGLQVTEAVSLNWQSGVEKLKQELMHHIEEEEGRVFSAAREILSDKEALVLGKIFRELKAKTGPGIVSSQVELVSNLMPERFRKSIAEDLRHNSSHGRHAS